MFSKNNKKMRAMKMATDRQQHFSLRKLSVGLVSVLMGTTVFLTSQSTTAKADTLPVTTSSTSSSADNTSQEANSESSATNESKVASSSSSQSTESEASTSQSSNNSQDTSKDEVATNQTTSAESSNTDSQAANNNTTELKVSGTDRAANTNALAESKAAVNDPSVQEVSSWNDFDSALRNSSISTINITADFSSNNYNNNVSRYSIASRTLTINGNGHTVDLGSIGYYMNPGAGTTADWTINNGTFYSKSATGPFAFLSGYDRNSKIAQARGNAIHRITLNDVTIYAGEAVYGVNAEVVLSGTDNLNAGRSYNSKFNGTVYTETGGNRSGVEAAWITISPNANVTVNSDHGATLSTQHSDGNRKIEVGENATLNASYLHTTYGTPDNGSKVAVLSNGENGGQVIFRSGSNATFNMPHTKVTNLSGNGNSSWGDGSVLYLGAATTTVEKGANVTLNNPKEAGNDNSIFIRNDGTQLNVFGKLVINDGARDYTVRMDNRVTLNVGQQINDSNFDSDNGQLIINRDGNFYLNNDGGALSLWGPITVNVNSGARLEVNSTGIDNARGTGTRMALLRVGGSSKLNVYKRGTFILKDSSAGKVYLVDRYGGINGNFNFDNTAKVVFDISQNGSQDSRVFSLPGTLVATNDSVYAQLSPNSAITNMGNFKKVQLPLNGSGTLIGTTLHSDYQQAGYNNIQNINNALKTEQLRYLEFSTRQVNKPSITGEGQGFTDNGAQLKGNVVDESTETGAVAVVYDSKNNELGRANVDDNGNFTINLAKPLLNKEGVRVRIETPRGAGAFATTVAPLGPTVKSPITVGRDQSLVGQDASQYITNKDAISNLKPGSTTFTDADYEPTFSKATWKSVDFDNKKGVITVTYKDNTTTDLTVDLNVKNVITDADKYTPEGGTIKVDNGHKLDGDDAYDAIKNHDDLPADKTTGYNWVVDDTHPAVDTTKPGDHKGYVQVAYEDGSKSDPVEVTVHVIGDNEKYNAVPKTLNVKKNDTVNSEDLIANREGDATQDGKTYSKLPDGTKYDWQGTPISTKDGGVKKGQVKVTYPDGTTQVVDVTVNVYEDANVSTVVGKDIDAKLNEDVSSRAIDAIDKDKSTNLPNDPKAYTWASKVDTSTSGDKPATVVVTYPDGSQNSVNVTVHVISDADKYPIATQVITVPKGYDFTKDKFLGANKGIGNDGKDYTKDGKNYAKLPDGTNYEWSGLGDTKVPDTSTPYEKNVQINVTYPDGSSKLVSTILRVTNDGQTDAEKEGSLGDGLLIEPVGTPLTAADSNGNVAWAEKGVKSANPNTKGVKFVWRSGYAPDGTKPGKYDSIAVVHYSDGSINEGKVTVIVLGDSDRYKLEANPYSVEKGKDISDKSWARKGIANIGQDGPTLVAVPEDKIKDVDWAENGKPDTSTTSKKIGKVKVTFKDGTSSIVNVPITVTDNGQSDAEKYPIDGQDISVYIGNKPDIKDGIKDPDKIKNLRSEDPFTWKGSEPDTSTKGDKDAVIIAHYEDGSSNEVQITVHVKSMADDFTPQGGAIKASLNEDISGTNRAEEAISNSKDMPEGTTYTWKEKVDTSKAGSKPATVIVTFKDKSTKEVPVTVQVSSLANDYKDKIDVKTDTRMIHAKWKGDIKNYPAVDGIANAKTETTTDGKNYPNLTPVLKDQDPGTAIVWKTAPDLNTPGLTSGVATITFKDGSTRDVTIPVLVQTDADANTPDVTTIKVKPGTTESLDATKGVENYGKDATHTKLPEGTKVTFDDQTGADDFAQHGVPGQTKKFPATITYPDGSTTKIEIPVHVIGDNEVYTPVPQGIKTTKGNLPEAKLGVENYDKDVTQDGKTISKLPDDTIVVWANPGQAHQDISNMNPGDTKNFDAVVIYPDKTTANISIPVTIAKDADIYPIVKQPIVLHDRTLPDNADDGLANLHKEIDFKTPQLPDGTHADWKDKAKAQEIVKNMTPGDTVSIPADVVFPDGSTKNEGMDVIVHLHGQADDVDIKTQQVDLNKDGSLPDAKKGIQDVDNIPHLKDVEWGKDKDGKPASELVKGMKPGDTRDIPAVVTFDDGSKKEVTIPVHMHGQADDYDVETQKVDTDKDGQLPENANKGIKNLDKLPEGTHADWGKDAQKTVDQTQPGTDVNVPAVVTFPDGSTKDVTISVHKYGISDDATVTPKEVPTEDGTLPDASEGIEKINFDGTDMTPDGFVKDGGKIEWGDGAEEAAKKLMPGESTKVTVKVTFRDGSEKDVEVTVTRKDNTPVDNTKPQPQPVNTDDQGNLPKSDDAIGNLGDLPKGTQTEWGEGAQETAKGLKPGEHTTVPVVVTIPGKDPQTVQVTVTHPTKSTGDITPEGQPVNTDDQGNLPKSDDAIGNLGDLPKGTQTEWGEGAQETAKGLKPGEHTTVPVVVTIPGKDPQTVQVTVTRPNPTPTPTPEPTPSPVDPETQGVDTDKDGNLPDPKTTVKNLPNLPSGTDVKWGEGANDKAKGLKPGESTKVPVVITIPGQGTKTYEVTVTRPKSTPTPTPTPAPKSDADTYGVETQPVKTDDHGKLPAADEGIKNLKDLPSGTHTKWGKGAQETVDQMKPGETKGIPATVEFPDGSKKDITISVTKVVVNHDSGNDSGNNSDDNNSKSDNNNNSATDNNSNNNNSNANANKANTTNNSKSQTSGNRNLNNNSSRHANKFDQVNADKLPQTGEKNEESVLSVLGMALLGLAGVALLKKKKED